jgi:hypothetical protein
MATFYFLSLLSGILEIAPFILLLRTEGILAALAVALCYQLGNLTPCPVALSGKQVKLAAVLSTVMFTAFALFGALPFLYVAVVCGSAAVQSTRAHSKENATKLLKRSLRVAGFGLGFICGGAAAGRWFLAAAGLILTVIAADRRQTREPDSKPALVLPRLNRMNIVSIIHQVHYFAYCYAALALAFVYAGPWAAMGLFILNWLVYVYGAQIYPPERKWGRSFILAHTLLTLVLLGIFFIPSLAVKAVLWVATGLFGTTEFCAVRLSLKTGGTKQGSTFAENTGHVLGVLVCMAVYVVTGSLLNTVPTGAAAACCAVLLTSVNLLTQRRQNVNENSRSRS